MCLESCHRHGRLAALLLSAVLADSAPAVDTAADPWMTDRYEIEIIVFRHLDQSRNTPEQAAGQFVIRSSPLDLDVMSRPAPLAAHTDPSAQGEATVPRREGPQVDFQLLEPDARFPDYVPMDGHQLKNVYARLERLDAYEPILYRAWLQAARPAKQAVPLPVAADPLDDLRLRGTITVYRERYLHMEVDLDLSAVAPEGTPSDADSLPTYGDVFAPQEPAPLVPTSAPAYHLQESRRIRGVNPQYFDHPQFGVIAVVSRVEVGEEAEEAADLSD